MMIKAACIVPLFIISCMCQFVMDTVMKPDVTFGEQNDRFDIASIVRDQNRMDIGNAGDDYRRLGVIYRRNNQKYRENYNNLKHTKYDKENEKNSKEYANNQIKTYNDFKNNEIKLDNRVVLLDALKDTVNHLNLRRNFPSHQKIKANSHPEVEAYEQNLEALRRDPQHFTGKRRSNLQKIVNRLHRGLPWQYSGRRGIPPDPVNEILFHYGVPVIMKVAGYIQVPLEENITGELNTN